MSRKDINGAIMVQVSGLMPLKVRGECDCNFSTLFTCEKLVELGFSEDCYA